MMIRKIDWVKTLKPGDEVFTYYPDSQGISLGTVTIEDIREDAAFNSTYSVKLKEAKPRLDIFWIEPL